MIKNLHSKYKSMLCCLRKLDLVVKYRAKTNKISLKNMIYRGKLTKKRVKLFKLKKAIFKYSCTVFI